MSVTRALTNPELPFAGQVQIPENLGTISDFSLGERGTGNAERSVSRSPLAVPQSERSIVLIQNAHANYDGQQKVRELLRYLDTTYGFKTVFVEGAAEKLDPSQLNYFSDAVRNKQLAEYLAKQGILSGAGLYLAESPKGVEGLGIEDVKLYRANYEALKTVFRSSSRVDRMITKMETRLATLFSKGVSPELRRSIADWQRFEKGHRDLLPFVNRLRNQAKTVLGLDMKNAFSQLEWPQIVRLIAVQEVEAELDIKKATEERVRLVRFLKSKRVADKTIRLVDTVFGDAPADAGTDYRSAFDALLRDARPSGLQLKEWPAFTTFAAYRTLKQELDALELFKEIEKLFGRITDALAKTSEENELLQCHRDLALFSKLLRLELSREDYSELRKRKISPEIMMRQLSGAQRATVNVQRNIRGQNVERRALSVAPAFNAAMHFYEFASKREQSFYQKIDQQMRERHIQKAVVVTGGFHTEGMRDILKEKGTGFAVVTPHISEGSDSRLYREAMIGKDEKPADAAFLDAAQPQQSEVVIIAQRGASYRSAIAAGIAAVSSVNDPSVVARTMNGKWVTIGERGARSDGRKKSSVDLVASDAPQALSLRSEVREKSLLARAAMSLIFQAIFVFLKMAKKMTSPSNWTPNPILATVAWIPLLAAFSWISQDHFLAIFSQIASFGGVRNSGEVNDALTFFALLLWFPSWFAPQLLVGLNLLLLSPIVAVFTLMRQLVLLPHEIATLSDALQTPSTYAISKKQEEIQTILKKLDKQTRIRVELALTKKDAGIDLRAEARLTGEQEKKTQDVVKTPGASWVDRVLVKSLGSFREPWDAVYGEPGETLVGLIFWGILALVTAGVGLYVFAATMLLSIFIPGLGQAVFRLPSYLVYYLAYGILVIPLKLVIALVKPKSSNTLAQEESTKEPGSQLSLTADQKKLSETARPEMRISSENSEERRKRLETGETTQRASLKLEIRNQKTAGLSRVGVGTKLLLAGVVGMFAASVSADVTGAQASEIFNSLAEKHLNLKVLSFFGWSVVSAVGVVAASFIVVWPRILLHRSLDPVFKLIVKKQSLLSLYQAELLLTDAREAIRMQGDFDVVDIGSDSREEQGTLVYKDWQSSAYDVYLYPDETLGNEPSHMVTDPVRFTIVPKASVRAEFRSSSHQEKRVFGKKEASSDQSLSTQVELALDPTLSVLDTVTYNSVRVPKNDRDRTTADKYINFIRQRIPRAWVENLKRPDVYIELFPGQIAVTEKQVRKIYGKQKLKQVWNATAYDRDEKALYGNGMKTELKIEVLYETNANGHPRYVVTNLPGRSTVEQMVAFLKFAGIPAHKILIHKDPRREAKFAEYDAALGGIIQEVDNLVFGPVYGIDDLVNEIKRKDGAVVMVGSKITQRKFPFGQFKENVIPSNMIYGKMVTAKRSKEKVLVLSIRSIFGQSSQEFMEWLADRHPAKLKSIFFYGTCGAINQPGDVRPMKKYDMVINNQVELDTYEAQPVRTETFVNSADNIQDDLQTIVGSRGIRVFGPRDGALTNRTVSNIGSENRAFISGLRKLGVRTVDMELAYLAQGVRRLKGVQLAAVLLVTDLPTTSEATDTHISLQDTDAMREVKRFADKTVAWFITQSVSGVRSESRGAPRDLILRAELMGDDFARKIDPVIYREKIRPLFQDRRASFETMDQDGFLTRAFPFVTDMKQKLRYVKGPVTLWDHSFQEMEYVRALGAGDLNRFNQNHAGWKMEEPISGRYRQAYEAFSSHDIELLNLFTFLHDTAILIQDLYHPELGSIIGKRIMEHLGFSSDDIQLVSWLVLHHVDLGTLFTGESAASVTWNGLLELPPELRDRAKMLLAFQTVGEVRSIRDGAYLLKKNAAFYLETMQGSELQKLSDHFDAYRTELFSAGDDNVMIGERYAQVQDLISTRVPTGDKEQFQNTYRSVIALISYGIYFFRRLDPETLVKVLYLLSQVEKINGNALNRLSFTAPTGEAADAAEAVSAVLKNVGFQDLAAFSARFEAVLKALNVASDLDNGEIRFDSHGLIVARQIAKAAEQGKGRAEMRGDLDRGTLDQLAGLLDTPQAEDKVSAFVSPLLKPFIDPAQDTEKIVLGSGSSRKQKTTSLMLPGKTIQTASADVDEYLPPQASHATAAMVAAFQKAVKLLGNGERGVIITNDTFIYTGAKRLGKVAPDTSEAGVLDVFKSYGGKTITAYSGLFVGNTRDGAYRLGYGQSDLRLRLPGELLTSDDKSLLLAMMAKEPEQYGYLKEIEAREGSTVEDVLKAYIHQGKWKGKAGGFGVQDREFWLYVAKVNGNPLSIVGLPSDLLARYLGDLGVPTQDVTEKVIREDYWPLPLEYQKINLRRSEFRLEVEQEKQFLKALSALHPKLRDKLFAAAGALRREKAFAFVSQVLGVSGANLPLLRSFLGKLGAENSQQVMWRDVSLEQLFSKIRALNAEGKDYEVVFEAGNDAYTRPETASEINDRMPGAVNDFAFLPVDVDVPAKLQKLEIVEFGTAQSRAEMRVGFFEGALPFFIPGSSVVSALFLGLALLIAVQQTREIIALRDRSGDYLSYAEDLRRRLRKAKGIENATLDQVLRYSAKYSPKTAAFFAGLSFMNFSGLWAGTVGIGTAFLIFLSAYYSVSLPLSMLSNHLAGIGNSSVDRNSDEGSSSRSESRLLEAASGMTNGFFSFAFEGAHYSQFFLPALLSVVAGVVVGVVLVMFLIWWNEKYDLPTEMGEAEIAGKTFVLSLLLCPWLFFGLIADKYFPSAEFTAWKTQVAEAKSVLGTPAAVAGEMLELFQHGEFSGDKVQHASFLQAKFLKGAADQLKAGGIRSWRQGHGAGIVFLEGGAVGLVADLNSQNLLVLDANGARTLSKNDSSLDLAAARGQFISEEALRQLAKGDRTHAANRLSQWVTSQNNVENTLRDFSANVPKSKSAVPQRQSKQRAEARLNPDDSRTSRASLEARPEMRLLAEAAPLMTNTVSEASSNVVSLVFEGTQHTSFLWPALWSVAAGFVAIAVLIGFAVLVSHYRKGQLDFDDFRHSTWVVGTGLLAWLFFGSIADIFFSRPQFTEWKAQVEQAKSGLGTPAALVGEMLDRFQKGEFAGEKISKASLLSTKFLKDPLDQLRSGALRSSRQGQGPGVVFLEDGSVGLVDGLESREVLILDANGARIVPKKYALLDQAITKGQFISEATLKTLAKGDRSDAVSSFWLWSRAHDSAEEASRDISKLADQVKPSVPQGKVPQRGEARTTGVESWKPEAWALAANTKSVKEVIAWLDVLSSDIQPGGLTSVRKALRQRWFSLLPFSKLRRFEWRWAAAHPRVSGKSLSRSGRSTPQSLIPVALISMAGVLSVAGPSAEGQDSYFDSFSYKSAQMTESWNSMNPTDIGNPIGAFYWLLLLRSIEDSPDSKLANTNITKIMNGLLAVGSIRERIDESTRALQFLSRKEGPTYRSIEARILREILEPLLVGNDAELLKSREALRLISQEHPDSRVRQLAGRFFEEENARWNHQFLMGLLGFGAFVFAGAVAGAIMENKEKRGKTPFRGRAETRVVHDIETNDVPGGFADLESFYQYLAATGSAALKAIETIAIVNAQDAPVILDQNEKTLLIESIHGLTDPQGVHHDIGHLRQVRDLSFDAATKTFSGKYGQGTPVTAFTLLQEGDFWMIHETPNRAEVRLTAEEKRLMAEGKRFQKAFSDLQPQRWDSWINNYGVARRVAAVEYLAEIKGPLVLILLTRVLYEEERPDALSTAILRRAVIAALCDRGAFSVVVEALNGRMPNGFSIIQVLGELKAKAALQEFFFYSNNFHLRLEALRELAKLDPRLASVREYFESQAARQSFERNTRPPHDEIRYASFSEADVKAIAQALKTYKIITVNTETVVVIPSTLKSREAEKEQVGSRRRGGEKTGKETSITGKPGVLEIRIKLEITTPAAETTIRSEVSQAAPAVAATRQVVADVAAAVSQSNPVTSEQMRGNAPSHSEALAEEMLYDHLALPDRDVPLPARDVEWNNSRDVIVVLGNPDLNFARYVYDALIELDRGGRVLVVGKGKGAVAEWQRLTTDLLKLDVGGKLRLADVMVVDKNDASMHTGMNIAIVAGILSGKGSQPWNGDKSIKFEQMPKQMILIQAPQGLRVAKRIFQHQWSGSKNPQGLGIEEPAFYTFALPREIQRAHELLRSGDAPETDSVLRFNTASEVSAHKGLLQDIARVAGTLPVYASPEKDVLTLKPGDVTDEVAAAQSLINDRLTRSENRNGMDVLPIDERYAVATGLDMDLMTLSEAGLSDRTLAAVAHRGVFAPDVTASEILQSALEVRSALTKGEPYALMLKRLVEAGATNPVFLLAPSDAKGGLVVPVEGLPSAREIARDVFSMIVNTRVRKTYVAVGASEVRARAMLAGFSPITDLNGDTVLERLEIVPVNASRMAQAVTDAGSRLAHRLGLKVQDMVVLLEGPRFAAMKEKFAQTVIVSDLRGSEDLVMARDHLVMGAAMMNVRLDNDAWTLLNQKIADALKRRDGFFEVDHDALVGLAQVLNQIFAQDRLTATAA